MDSEERIYDWANLPDGTQTFSLWHSLHDGSLLSVTSDLLAGTVTLRFEVDYVRDFHQLPEGAHFFIALEGVQSVRALCSVPWPGEFSIPQGTPREQQSSMVDEYQAKWREESRSWAEFEGLTDKGLEVMDATLARGANSVALKLEVMVENDSYERAYLRGEGITFIVGDRKVTQEEFLALGEAYWEAFSARQRT